MKEQILFWIYSEQFQPTCDTLEFYLNEQEFSEFSKFMTLIKFVNSLKITNTLNVTEA